MAIAIGCVASDILSAISRISYAESSLATSLLDLSVKGYFRNCRCYLRLLVASEDANLDYAVTAADSRGLAGLNASVLRSHSSCSGGNSATVILKP